MDTCKVAMIAALEREIGELVRDFSRVDREHGGRRFVFFEGAETVVIAGGIGVEAARRAAEATVALYRPVLLHSVGFAGALQPELRVADIVVPAVVINAGDGSRIQVEGGAGVLVTSPHVAGITQKAAFARAYGAQAVDMEAAAVAVTARSHGIEFRATKVISDGFDFEMPEMADFVDARGRFKTANFALFTALRPWLWPRVFRLAANSRKAAKALSDYLMDTCHLSAEAIQAKTI